MQHLTFLYETSTRTTVTVRETNGTYSLLIQDDADEPQDPAVLRIDKRKLFQNRILYILDSIKSGTGNRGANDVYSGLMSPILHALGINYQYIGTEHSLLIHEFAEGLVATEQDITLLLIGGDTSVNEFINSFRGGSNGRLKLIVVPAGTGNALALSLGINDHLTAFRLLLSDSTNSFVPLNLYQATFPAGSHFLYSDGTRKLVTEPLLFLVVTSWAFHASLVADSDEDELRKAGIERFKIAARQNLEWRQEYFGLVNINNDSDETIITHEGPFAYFVVTPAKKFEPIFDILPEGDIRDSSLYAIGFNTEDSSEYIMDIMNEVYDGGKHIQNEKVFYDHVDSSLSIVLKIGNNEQVSSRRFCVDGAIVVVPNHEKELHIRHHGTSKNGCEILVAGAFNSK